ncbi:MAG: relaxase/mobilization nuclease domain-containing protein [Candidatus Pseudoruminococcus sp.]|nr:relaxase/mobilization nuclease domain-containing protein [Ruminococcus sp.]MDY2783539.1 relaxase/mobilization nuclease domain-containing protein [Candidatus Pseudoruminococcus sp.]
MAICKEVEKKIKSHQYVFDSIAYTLSPENSNGDEKCFQATCLNCDNNGADSLSEQFYAVRKAFNKDNKILTHHYVQSFSPDEKVTPELAHRIGVELAQKIAPGFQVIVSTHIDKDHIHNHFLINSVNIDTGMKWKADKATRKNMRKVSDTICKQYGLSIIKNESGLRGIDQATQKLAEQGKSWKVELCKALDEATKICNSKKEFIEFMKHKSFIITRYEKDITFQKVGEKKRIRVSRLAREFGDCYTKENLEKLMGFYRLPKKSEIPKPSEKKKVQTNFKSEFERYEQNYFRKNPPPAKVQELKTLKRLIKNSRSPLLMLLLIIMMLLIRQRSQRNRLDRKYSLLHLYCKQAKYKVKKVSLEEKLSKIEKIQTTAGNIPYKNLIESQGENYRVRLALSAVPKLYAYPFFFSAKLYKDYALVTIKEKDKKLLQTALEVEDIQVLEKHNKHYTPLSDYYELKARAEHLGVKVEFLNIQKEQLSKLDDEKDRFVAIETKDGKIRLAFLPQNKDYILHTLYPEKYKDSNLFSVVRNSKVNTRLRSEALLAGQKMRYRVLTKSQVEQLAASGNDELFAVFNKNAKGESLGESYNIAFKESDEQKINEALNNPNKRKI